MVNNDNIFVVNVFFFFVKNLDDGVQVESDYAEDGIPIMNSL